MNSSRPPGLRQCRHSGTGASRGLGLALAEEFGRLGAKLVLAARDSEELNRAGRLLLSREGGEADRVVTCSC
jgi:NAD(P)-dependent dehydrogenase (short-subunit alcohol dehydrogenase family)